jgi:hypothetical protein
VPKLVVISRFVEDRAPQRSVFASRARCVAPRDNSCQVKRRRGERGDLTGNDGSPLFRVEMGMLQHQVRHGNAS